MVTRQPPRFRGVRTYQDPKGRFSFRYPTDWYEFELTEDREGILFAPDAEDPKTWFSVWVAELGEPIVAEDLEVLRSGVNEGIAELAGSKVELESEDVFGNLIKFDRSYTFQEDGATRKRKVWILYVDRWQIVTIWQGENEEEYEYWLPMGNYSFATFNLPEALWFSTDRDLSGYSKA